ncbi:MAG: hypothetical protein LUC31_02705 [Coprobacillus sp.]|nr:hypothetical protein [Coprobacillus sp.]
MKKRLFLMSCIALLSVGCVTMTSCKGKDERKNESVSVELYGLYAYYYPTDSIDWDSVYLDVTVYDKKEEIDHLTLTSGEFDVSKQTSEESDFALNTSGLYTNSINQNTIPEGTYSLSYSLDYNGRVYSDSLFSITVASNFSGILEAETFQQPDSIIKFLQNQQRVDSEDSESESNFIDYVDEYVVGDDNPFIYRPTLDLVPIGDSSARHSYPNGYPAIVTVTYDGKELDLDNNEYVTFDSATFGFQFTSEAIGKSFTLSVFPKDFNADWSGLALQTQSLTVTVQDGYNVFKALDLGRMALSSGADYYIDETNHTRTDNKGNYYVPFSNYMSEENILFVQDETTGQAHFEKIRYDETWYNFLESRGETNLNAVNGIFLHDDMVITNNDLPSEFIIGEDEAKFFGVEYDDMVGSLRDEVTIYDHQMEEDFTLNGNLFDLDASHLKWAMTRHLNDDPLEGDESERQLIYYTENNTSYDEGHNVLLYADNHITKKDDSKYLKEDFLTTHDGENKKVYTLKNVELFGNQERNWNFDQANETEDASKASGCMTCFESRAGSAVVNNVIVKHFLTSFYSNYTLSGVKCLNISDSKIYDCYGCALYARYSAENVISNSVLRRFGGPVVVMMSGEGICAHSGYDYSKVGFEFTSDVDCEANLYGGESWFDIYNIKSYISYLNWFDVLFTGGSLLGMFSFPSMGKTMFNPERSDGDYFNLIGGGFDYRVYGGYPIYTSLSYNGVDYTYDSHYGQEFSYVEDGDPDDPDNPDYTYTDIDGFEPDTECFSYLVNSFINDSSMSSVDLSGFLTLTTLPVFMTNTGEVFALASGTKLLGLPLDMYLVDLKAYYNREDESSNVLNYKFTSLNPEDDTVFMYLNIAGIVLTLCFSLYDCD